MGALTRAHTCCSIIHQLSDQHCYLSAAPHPSILAGWTGIFRGDDAPGRRSELESHLEAWPKERPRPTLRPEDVLTCPSRQAETLARLRVAAVGVDAVASFSAVQAEGAVLQHTHTHASMTLHNMLTGIAGGRGLFSRQILPISATVIR